MGVAMVRPAEAVRRIVRINGFALAVLVSTCAHDREAADGLRDASTLDTAMIDSSDVANDDPATIDAPDASRDGYEDGDVPFLVEEVFQLEMDIEPLSVSFDATPYA